MPKLLQINCCLNLSTGKIAQQIGEHAISKGWESWIAFSGRTKQLPTNSKVIIVGNFFDACIHYLLQMFFDNEGLNSSYYTMRLLKKIDEIRPDVVQLHNIHDHWLNYKILFTYLANMNIPVVWTQHDQWATTGHCFYNMSGCERWKDECHDCPLSKWYSLDRSRENHRLKKKLLASIPSLTIVSVSNWLDNNISQSHLKNRPRLVIHNGIDIRTFSPKTSFSVRDRLGIAKNKKIVLGVAALWDMRKGLNDFYAIAQILPPNDYAIIIVGQLTELIKISENGCQMVFVNCTQNALELAQLYSAASVFVNPTYQDNYPTTNLEALACGTPVITYRTGGSPEAVDEKTGIVVAQGNVSALADAIMSLRDKQLSSDDCRKRAELNFDKDMCFENYIKLYEQLVEKSSK